MITRQYTAQYGRPPRVLDPFASDYNPVAVFIEKVALE
jgi:hypothetical protein